MSRAVSCPSHDSDCEHPKAVLEDSSQFYHVTVQPFSAHLGHIVRKNKTTNFTTI